jgi:hypothetical protein
MEPSVKLAALLIEGALNTDSSIRFLRLRGHVVSFMAAALPSRGLSILSLHVQFNVVKYALEIPLTFSLPIS